MHDAIKKQLEKKRKIEVGTSSLSKKFSSPIGNILLSSDRLVLCPDVHRARRCLESWRCAICLVSLAGVKRPVLR